MTVQPGRVWVWVRRLTQCLALLAVVTAPLLGGWQRMDRAEMAVWGDPGWNVPGPVRDLLPLGKYPRQAYDSLILAGGGVAVDYAGVPAVDPVAGASAMWSMPLSWRFVLALAGPVLLALLLGRVFCGWLCPFGVIARALDAVRVHLPWRALSLPERRPVRFVLLVAILLAGALGAHWLVFLFLPHLVLQQTVYGLWLLGGGGAMLGVFIGLVVAGLFFGPTVYCAAVCPTGALLGLLGRRKLVRVTLSEPRECGAHCSLCDSACWLRLRPASGDPGPDCDSCARCFAVCPRTNMRVAVLESPRKKHLSVVTAVLIGAFGLGGGSVVHAAPVMGKPELLLRGETMRGRVTAAVSIVDQTGVKLDPDAPESLYGVELSVYVRRASEAGSGGEVYDGPLVVRVGDVEVAFSGPTAPASTPRRTIYRRELAMRPGPGTRVVLAPVPGWLDEPVTWRIPEPGARRSFAHVLVVALAATLVFSGLLSLALAVRPGSGTPARPETEAAAPG